MNNNSKKILSIVLEVLAYLVGFPLMIVLAFILCKPFAETNLYGLFAYLPVIIGVVLWLVFIIFELCMRLTYKKKLAKGKKTSLAKQTTTLVAVAVIALTGFMAIIDFVFPPLLNTATQGTITYEDLKGSPVEVNDLLVSYADTFIEWNYNNGNLENENEVGGHTLEWYKEQKFNHDKTAKLAKLMFAIADNAFQSFDSLGIELALADERFMGYSCDGQSVMGLLMAKGLSVNYKLSDEELALLSEDLQDFATNYGTEKATLGASLIDMLGSIPEGIDLPVDISELLHCEKYGMLDYMHMAWIDSVQLLGLISLFNVRELFYLFAAVIALLTLFRGMLRQNYYLSKEAEVNTDDAQNDNADGYAENNDNVVYEEEVVVYEEASPEVAAE